MGFRRSRLFWAIFLWLDRLGWPSYDCEDCIGAGPGPCYCAYYGGVAPGGPPSEVHDWLRVLHGFLFMDTSQFWDEYKPKP
ncbi:hypothetical protein CcrColossus_gp210 [Caulobacter phage CcrColossus]|uniref:Uncharacterized protein n=1 Tax=Caulobacter phage CcrColossus TaxID=1211640 RepID=K4JUQ0_9CAUD|nr:hypothetical protein CcrColossus_gp210 [Caulobacter phage CcrColossus]AFU88080.1 hypothetical protein CcrColossus_gp210 [Caulobacter phage CcrColossus]